MTEIYPYMHGEYMYEIYIYFLVYFFIYQNKINLIFAVCKLLVFEKNTWNH